MNETILVAIIAALGSVLGQWLISREREARLDERLKGVERRLDEHNSYAKKFETIQIDIASIKTELKYFKEAN